MLQKPLRKLLPAYSRLQESVLASSRRVKQSVAVVFDLFSAMFCVWMAFSLRLELWHLPAGGQWVVYLLAPLLMLPVFTYAGLYRAIHRHSGFAMFITVINAALFYGALFFSAVLLLNLPHVPRSVAMLQPILFLLITGGSRALVRFVHHNTGVLPKKQQAAANRLLIYGAGSAGAEIAGAIERSAKFDLAGYLDDDPQLHGRTINGKPVFSPEEAETLIVQQGIGNILLAMPSASRSRRYEIVAKFRSSPVRIQMLPGIEELADGRVSIADIKEVDIEDLLGRDPLKIDQERIRKHISGRVVMVTGAGGSIGSELCRQLLGAQPATLLLVEHAEHSLYAIHSDLEQRSSRLALRVRLVPLLCDVTDEGRIDDIIRVFGPEVIYHAAAYKHVPMVEFNSAEGVRNNVSGTRTVAEAARRNGVPRFVLVSTDKAVRPTNVMGASKRLCEMVLQALAAEPGHSTCFSMVRFGNVLGSSGSVVPLFRRQIREGGPITITHQDITRYFMTIPEASQLVIKAGTIATGGDVFLLDMGEPVKIIELACRMVELSGLTVRDEAHPEGDIEIRISGLRPGEKLYEELLIDNNPEPTVNPRIFRASEQFMPWQELATELARLTDAISRNEVRTIKKLLKKMIPEYQPAQGISDFLAIEQEMETGIGQHATVAAPVEKHAVLHRAETAVHGRAYKSVVREREKEEAFALGQGNGNIMFLDMPYDSFSAPGNKS
ncbi:MAG: polysaccharide biosynthesis protein [Chlorobium sp.]|uniref:polysaccharide biosynthesis protein n=1 Tax=Chlorobium sp. TaxID=1095 RepID=UPI0025C4ECC5|nr:nucleoside-diphosphate sugar epimerase/dehydratase [Chlorobium sp.]MCF8384060.1 polysaccharide biosynthesis protein [Chlorobium sp.]